MEPKWKQHAEQFRIQIKNDIMETTKALILEMGITNITIMDISKKTGISRVTFYKHYNSIHEIVVDIQIRILSEMVEAIKSDLSKGNSGAEKLRNTLKSFIAFFKSHREDFRFIGIFDHAYGKQFPSEELEQKYSDTLARIKSPISDVLDSGLTDLSLKKTDSDTDLIAITIFHSLMGLMQRLATRLNVLKVNRLDEEDLMFECFIEMIMNSLASKPGCD